MNVDSAIRTCPPEAVLRELLEPAVADSLVESWSRHLGECEPCQRRLSELAGAPLPAVRRNLASESAASAVLEKLMRRLREDAGIPGGGPGAIDPSVDLSWLAPARTAEALGVFAGYDVLSLIAAGGMGLVFRAFDGSLNRVVALKVLAPVLAVSESARARFLREARAAAAVIHEFVVPIHAVGEANGLPYLVMQFVAGKSLDARLADRPFRTEEILRIGLQVARGLAAAHAQGLIHRDIKPGNILLENGVERVKLTDFGLARAVDDPGLTRIGVVAGTPEFMSPEQARGERLDSRSDLFSLGAVLYLMATGRSPFQADSTPATLRRVCEEHPSPAEVVRAGHPVWLAERIEELLHKNPADRPDLAAEVADLLEHQLHRRQLGLSEAVVPGSLHTETAPTPPTPPTPPIQPGRRRGPFGVAAAAVAGVVLLLSAYAVLREKNRSKTPATTRESTPLPTTPKTDPLSISAAAPGPFVRRSDQSGLVVGYPDLGSAVTAAATGDTIELAFDGPLRSSPVTVRGKALTLRARDSHRPQLVNASTTEPLFSTDGPLLLEGIEFRTADGDADARHWIADLESTNSAALRWISSGLYARAEGAPPRPVLIESHADRFQASRCRFVTSVASKTPFDVLGLLHPVDVNLEHCEFYSLVGFCLRARLGPEKDAHPVITLTNCLLLATQPIGFGGPAPAPYRIQLNHCTVTGSRLLSFRSAGAGEIEIRHSLIACRRLFSFTGSDLPPPPLRWLEATNLFCSPFGRGAAENWSEPALGPGSSSGILQWSTRIAAAAPDQPLRAVDFRMLREEWKRLQGEQNLDPLGFGCETETVGPKSARQK